MKLSTLLGTEDKTTAINTLQCLRDRYHLLIASNTQKLQQSKIFDCLPDESQWNTRDYATAIYRIERAIEHTLPPLPFNAKGLEFDHILEESEYEQILLQSEAWVNSEDDYLIKKINNSKGT